MSQIQRSKTRKPPKVIKIQELQPKEEYKDESYLKPFGAGTEKDNSFTILNGTLTSIHTIPSGKFPEVKEGNDSLILSDDEEVKNLSKDHTSMKQTDIEEVMEFVDILWESKDNPDQAKVVLQAFKKYQTDEENKQENDSGNILEELDLESQSDTSVNKILKQSNKFAEELEMKMDKMEDIIELKKQQQLEKNLEDASLLKSIEMIEKFKIIDGEDPEFSLKETQARPEVNLKIENELCDMIVEFDLDLLIEFPPSELNVQMEECHNLNEEIQTLLVQRTINSVKGARVKTLSKRADLLLSQFLQNLLDQRLNLPLKIGISLDSLELRESFASIITNLHNVFYMDSRKINSFYLNIIENNLFGDQFQPIDFMKFLKTDYLRGKNLASDFCSTIFFAMFQDSHCYNYANDMLVKGVYKSKNHRIQNILTNKSSVPMKMKVFVSQCYIKLKSLVKSNDFNNTYSENETEFRIYLLLFFILLHTFWIPYSKKCNKDCYGVFRKLSEIFQAVPASSLLLDNNIRATMLFIRNILITEKSEIPPFAPKYPRNEQYSSIFSLSLEQIYALHLSAKAYYKQRYVHQRHDPRYGIGDHKKELIKEILYQMSTEPDLDFAFLSHDNYNSEEMKQMKRKKKLFCENDVAILSIEMENNFDPSQYITLSKRTHKHMNLLDKWIEYTKKKDKNTPLDTLIKVSDALQAVREIRESGPRIKKYTKHVQETKISKISLENLLKTLESK
ncbi:unnamed protein product [Moneuplotes crassus]|uniref:Uncharacterized protein n=1 Tax=Euplotes crassus TaxID=5936 RepID=A0AAD2DBA9_EUPCR|nr:unnamed protein product [Moneuplotes crassus]